MNGLGGDHTQVPIPGAFDIENRVDNEKRVESSSGQETAFVELAQHRRDYEQQYDQEIQQSEIIEAAKNVPLPETPDEALDSVGPTVVHESKADRIESRDCQWGKNETNGELNTPQFADNSQTGHGQTPASSPEYHSCTEDSIEHLSTPAAWIERDERNVCQPFDYVMALPGKSFRSQLLSALNVWLQVDERSFSIIDRVVGMLHNASLLIDDIQDDSVLRRGSPAAHCLFGVAQTINAANYAYFLAQNELLAFPNPFGAFQIFNEEMVNLHRGQGLELFWRDTMTVPTEAEYIKMVSNKTGGLVRLAARLLQNVSSTSHNVVPLAELIGRIFQIRDDYQNLCSDKMAATKGKYEDLTEGKFSFPVVHAIRTGPSRNNPILNILRLRTTDLALKEYVVWYLRTQSYSLKYTLDTLDSLHGQAQVALGHIDGKNLEMERVLDSLSLDRI